MHVNDTAWDEVNYRSYAKTSCSAVGAYSAEVAHQLTSSSNSLSSPSLPVSFLTSIYPRILSRISTSLSIGRYTRARHT